MAEDPDSTPEEDSAEAPVESEADVVSQETVISPEDEAAGEAAIEAMGFGADDRPISVSDLT